MEKEKSHSPPCLEHEGAIHERKPDLSQPYSTRAGDYVGPRIGNYGLEAEGKFQFSKFKIQKISK